MTANKVLIIDDEKNNRNSIIRLFEEFDIDFIEAENGADGLEQVIKLPNPDLILLDIKMPVMDGFEFLSKYHEMSINQKATICVMTANSDSDTRRKAIYLGADDFICKPLDPVELETRVTSLLRISRYQRDLTNFNKTLEKLVKERTHLLEDTLEKLKITEKLNAKSYREMLSRISYLSKLSQPNNRPSSKKIGLFTAAIAWIYGLDGETAEMLSLSSQVYDIGMLALPEHLRTSEINRLSEPDRLKFLEYPELGAKLFENSDTPLLTQAYKICLTHRERYDGDGTPKGLIAESIPIESRLFSTAYLIVSTIDENHKDPYFAVVSALKQSAGKTLDPNIVEVLLNSNETLKDTINQLA